MGGVIEPLEEFYFRHDSNQNPPYQKSFKKKNEASEKDRALASRHLVSETWMSKVIDKMQL